MDETEERPTPGVEPPERFPGGVDSIGDEEKYGDIPDAPLIRDLDSESNPAAEDTPEELKEPEEGSEGPTSDGASEPEKETQA